MHFGLTDDQQLLQDTARAFVERHCPPAKAKEWDETHHFPLDVWERMSELGWFSLPFPQDWGGGGGTPTDVCIIAEALGRASLDMAMTYTGTFIPGMVVYDWGSPELRERYRSTFLEGTGRFAMAISEPDAGSDAASLSTRAEDMGDHFLVNGQKMWCTGAGLPGAMLATYVRTDPDAPKHRGLSLLLIPNDSPGIEIRRTPTLARHILGTNEVFLTDVVVPKENLVGSLNGGFTMMLAGLDYEKTVMSACYTGVAQATLDEALEYSKQRQQFGRRVGEFQALTHEMVDRQTEIDAARLLSYRAAWMLTNGQECTREASMAKLFCSETYVNTARWGMQIMAAHGFSTESIMSFRYRESIVATISGGTSQIQRNAVARSMGLRSY